MPVTSRPEPLQTGKDRLRREVWARMEKERLARFPGARGRIPNFVGSERAAERLEELAVWRKARRIKANPDSAQAPARKRARKTTAKSSARKK